MGHTRGKIMSRNRCNNRAALIESIALCLILGGAGSVLAQTDPGPRGGTKGAGGPFPALNANEQAFFNAARGRFQDIASVSGAGAGEDGVGLRPSGNANRCAPSPAEPD